MNDRQKLASRFLGSALGFHLAAKHIADENWPDITGQKFAAWPLFYTNLGYAIELSLKAYIAYCGKTENHIRWKIGHDLTTALNSARTAGLSKPDDGVIEFIEKIGPYHKDRRFVYLTDFDVVDVDRLPNFSDAIAASCKLIQMIEQKLPINDLIISNE
jgi:hypothetical protein